MSIESNVNKALENLLADYYQELGIKNGDISPMQQMAWENSVKDIGKLFRVLIAQNIV